MDEDETERNKRTMRSKITERGSLHCESGARTRSVEAVSFTNQRGEDRSTSVGLIQPMFAA